MVKPSPDVLFLIRARIDSGKARGAPQLRKDVQALKKAAEEIERLRSILAAMDLPAGIEPGHCVRLAEALESLNLQLHAGPHDAVRPAVVCGAAALRWLAARPVARRQIAIEAIEGPATPRMGSPCL